MATATYIRNCRTLGFGPLIEYQVYSIAGKPLGAKLEMTPEKAKQFSEKAGFIWISAANLFAIEELETVNARIEYRDYLAGRAK